VSAAVAVAAPVANPGAERTIRAATATAITASASTGTPTAWLWALGGDCPVGSSIADTAAESTTITIPTFGQCTVTLTVTDAMMASDDADVIIGAVPTNSNDVVDLASIGTQYVTVFGSLPRWGASPWPWQDDRHSALSDLFGGYLTSEADMQAEWDTLLTGTVSTTNGNASVTGSGTSFQTALCAGGTSPASGNIRVIIHDDAGERRIFEISGCPSQTSLTLASNYTGTTDSGLSWAKMTDAGVWIGGGQNWNYYDSGLAHYSMWLRSGITRHRDYARTLLDRWWTMPYVDEGRCVARGLCHGAPRLKSTAGLMLRALDGVSSMWPGIRLIVAEYLTGIDDGGGRIDDVREEGYELGFAALCAMLDPDAGERAACLAAVNNSLDDKWEPQQRVDGAWHNRFYGISSWNGGTGTAAVTNGMTSVTGTGTNWNVADDFPSSGNWFLICYIANPLVEADCDSTAYTGTINSTTSITLDTPYAGTTNGARYWQWGNLVGFGTQPFQLGIVGSAMRWAYLATSDARPRQYVIDLADWIRTTGYYSDTRGIYFGRVSPNCEPDPSIIAACNNSADTNPKASRFLTGEVINVVATAYEYSLDPLLLAFGDDLVGAALAEPMGGPNNDDNDYVEHLLTAQITPTRKSKDFAFWFGFGNSPHWAAVRAAEPYSSIISGGVTLGGGTTVR